MNSFAEKLHLMRSEGMGDAQRDIGALILNAVAEVRWADGGVFYRTSGDARYARREEHRLAKVFERYQLGTRIAFNDAVDVFMERHNEQHLYQVKFVIDAAHMLAEGTSDPEGVARTLADRLVAAVDTVRQRKRDAGKVEYQLDRLPLVREEYRQLVTSLSRSLGR